MADAPKLPPLRELRFVTNRRPVMDRAIRHSRGMRHA
jgi:hypothetical protein